MWKHNSEIVKKQWLQFLTLVLVRVFNHSLISVVETSTSVSKVDVLWATLSRFCLSFPISLEGKSFRSFPPLYPPLLLLCIPVKLNYLEGYWKNVFLPSRLLLKKHKQLHKHWKSQQLLNIDSKVIMLELLWEFS